MTDSSKDKTVLELYEEFLKKEKGYNISRGDEYEEITEGLRTMLIDIDLNSKSTDKDKEMMRRVFAMHSISWRFILHINHEMVTRGRWR